MQNRRLFLGWVSAIVFCMMSLLSPTPLFAKEAPFHGSLTNRYRLRTTGAVNDQDRDSTLTLDFGDPSYQRVTAALQAGYIQDINGDQAEDLHSVYDAFGSGVVGRLYFAYIDVQKIPPIESLRIGRQHNYDFETFHFDGLSLETKGIYGLRFGVYGGVPVHLFESQWGFDVGDWLAGTNLTWTPVQRLRLRLDYVHLKDEAVSFRVDPSDQTDDLLGAALTLDILESWDAHARFTTFADQMRDVTVASTINLDKQKLAIELRGYRLLEGYDIRVPDLDAYSIAGTYAPYNEWGLTVTKDLGKKISAEAGFVWRLLDDQQTTSAFNHGYKKVFGSLMTSGFIDKNLSLTVTGDYYHGEDSVFRDNYVGASFSLRQGLFKKRLTVDAGTAYYLYHYNLAMGNELYNLQTYFLKLTNKFGKNWTVKSGYEFEHNDLNDFHTFDFNVIWDF